MKEWFLKVKMSNDKLLAVLVALCAALVSITMLNHSMLAQGPVELLEEFLVSSVEEWGEQAIFGSLIVFEKNDDIYGYDLSTHTEFRVTDHAALQESPNISRDTIVWMDQRNGNWDIYGYDLSENREFQITDHAADQRWPLIDGQTVVWVDWRNGSETFYGYDLYGYDLTSGAEFHISGHSAPVACPAISGSVVVWSDRRFEGWELYSYDLSSSIETQISHWWAGSYPYCAAISDGVIVLGQDNYVFGIDLSGSLLFETATLSSFPDNNPVNLAIDGSLVVWQEGPLPGVGLQASDIVGYDIDSDHTFLISSSGHQAQDPAISGDVVVWREFGDLIHQVYPRGVYASKLLETVQLDVNASAVSPGDSITYTITLAEATITETLKSITNTAIISDRTSIFSRTVSIWIARRTYLPVILRNFSP